MSVTEVVSAVRQQTAEVGVILVLGLIDAIVNAFLGTGGGSSRGDDES
jgi:hypothetical protein